MHALHAQGELTACIDQLSAHVTQQPLHHAARSLLARALLERGEPIRALNVLLWRFILGHPDPRERDLIQLGLMTVSKAVAQKQLQVASGHILAATELAHGDTDAAVTALIASGHTPADRSQFHLVTVKRELTAGKLEPDCTMQQAPADYDLSPMGQVDAPKLPSFTYLLNGGSVLGLSFIPATADGTAIPVQQVHTPELARKPNPYVLHDVVRVATDSHLLLRYEGEDWYPGQHVLLGSCENWGHWLINHFSRLSLVRASNSSHLPVVVGEGLRANQVACLTRAGIAPSQILPLPRKRLARFEQLQTPSMLLCGLPSAHGLHHHTWWTPRLPHELRKLLDIPAGSSPGRRRIYLHRGQGRWRRLINEREVLDFLLSQGFESIEPGNLSLDQQIELAADAQIMVGPLGANMAMHWFAPPGIPVIELKYELEYFDVSPYFAQALGQPLYEIFGQPAAGTSDNSFNMDFTIPIERLQSVLAEAIAQTRA